MRASISRAVFFILACLKISYEERSVAIFSVYLGTRANAMQEWRRNGAILCFHGRECWGTVCLGRICGRENCLSHIY